MAAQDYAQFLEWAIRDYAEQQVIAGAWPAAQADELSAQTFASLLPDGLNTAGQFLFTIVADQQMVGLLWFGIRQEGQDRFAALYDIAILEPHRRRGYGRLAMLALEERVRQEGLDNIKLHVFGHNHAARALYRQLGYVEKHVTMTKKIAP